MEIVGLEDYISIVRLLYIARKLCRQVHLLVYMKFISIMF